MLLVINFFLYPENKTILFQVESNYPPFKFIENNVLTGFDIELSEFIFDKEYEVEYSYDTWDKVYDRLKKGEITTCGLLSVTEDRKKDIIYSQPVLKTHFAIYSRKADYKIKYEDLNKYKVSVVKGYYTESLLKDNLKINNYITYKNFDECIDSIVNKESDILFGNQEVINFLLIKKNLTGLVIPNYINLYPVDFAYGISKKDGNLAQYINTRIDHLKKIGIYEELYEKYFFIHSDYYQKNQNKKLLMIVWISLLGLLVLFVVLFLYIKVLRKKIIIVNQELFKDHEKLRVVLTSIGDAVFATDMKGIISFVNQAALNLNETSEIDTVGKYFDDIVNIELQKMRFSIIDEIRDINNSKHRFLDNALLISQSGKKIWISMTFSPIQNKDKKISGIVMVLRNINERKLAIDELNNYKNHLEELVKDRTLELIVEKNKAESANYAKSIFLANMSHELRTPLNGILGYTQIMKLDNDINDSHLEILTMIEQSGNHLLTLINDILDISRIEAGRLNLRENEIEFESFLLGIAGIIIMRVKEKGLEFNFEPVFELPHKIISDETRLRQILLNLLGNAVKFTNKGSVTFLISVQNKVIKDGFTIVKLLFEITDTGIGIQSDQLDKLFQPFVQVGAENVKDSGAGLGLAISQAIVKSMGGEIKVKSRINEGSTFSFELEFKEIFSDERKIINKKITGYIGNKYKILVADDKDYNRKVLVNLLIPLGFNLIEAVDGKNAVEMADNELPDLIFMDLRMPVLSGIEASKIIKMTHKDKIKIIAVSANVFENDKTDCLEVGCDDFLPKPIIFNNLIEILEKNLGIKWFYEE
jgi:PAS domain S-box-containing protein